MQTKNHHEQESILFLNNLSLASVLLLNTLLICETYLITCLFISFWTIHSVESSVVPILQGLALGTAVQQFHYAETLYRTSYAATGPSRLLTFTDTVSSDWHFPHVLLSKPSLLFSPSWKIRSMAALWVPTETLWPTSLKYLQSGFYKLNFVSPNFTYWSPNP